MLTETELFGRQLLVPQAASVPPKAVVRPGIRREHGTWVCQRCATHLEAKQAALPRDQFYCYQCLNLGRVSTLTKLVSLPEPNHFEPISRPLAWRGKLTEAQQACAEQVQRVFRQGGQHLLWAVTGAGKTEMLFLGLAAAIQAGLRVAVASPRVDVCIELYPRLTAAFPSVTSCLLHGRQTASYQYTQLVVCTTHQLLRFRSAFDVLVIDEVDAFPFAENPRLEFAVRQAKKPQGALLYLTATPSSRLLKAVQRHSLTISYLPLRFHGHLLPEIRLKMVGKWYRNCQQGRIPRSFRRLFQQYQQQTQRFLLFVPQVVQLPAVLAAIQKALPMYQGASVHSTDPDRLTKVQKMRNNEYQYLVTTTILERGVTLPGIDVLVLGADDPVFSTAALVQIAGRAGRSADRPTGVVLFGCSQVTRTIKAACQQIKTVNAKGRKLRAKTMSAVSKDTE